MNRDEELIRAAHEGVRNAYTKKDGPNEYRIGAAVLTEKGTIYSSGLYRSHTASLTLHAEQAVLAHAAAHGEYAIKAIAVTGNDVALERDGTIYPCHMCKQLLWESYLRSGINMEILIVKNNKITERLWLKDIMSYTWPR